ncbi:MAG: FitA-like ribbon-helix-helix domain-containing protein [Bryobacteraceae bacterium]
MATLYVENVPDEIYDALKARARDSHRSIAAETIAILESSVPTKAELKRREEFYKRILSVRAKAATASGPSVEQLLREDRER